MTRRSLARRRGPVMSAILIGASLVVLQQTDEMLSASEDLLRARGPDCRAQFANALRGNDMPSDRLQLHRVTAVIPRADGSFECRAEVSDMQLGGKTWGQPFRYPLPAKPVANPS